MVVATGAVSSGQGHETSFAQICADVLGVPLEWVTVTGGDTAAVPFGIGTFASRSGVTAGNSIADAARTVRARVVKAAAAVLEASEADIEIEDGQVFVRGAQMGAVPLSRVIQAAIPTFARPGVTAPDFEAVAYHHVPTVTYASAVHVAQVEVDRESGTVRLLRYVVAHDCGTVINPLIVEGQLHGGVVQGIGQALMEMTVYDDDGQFLTGSFMDYALPRAIDSPEVGVIHHPVPAKTNVLGVKGCGEAGCAGSLTCVMNAIADALSQFGIRHLDMPATPYRVWRAIQDARVAPAA